MKYVIVISWQSPEPESWVYGTYDRQPTPSELAATRQHFMENTTTSDNDWDEFGCSMESVMLVAPVTG